MRLLQQMKYALVWLLLLIPSAGFGQQAVTDEASQLHKLGLQNVQETDSTIRVQLMYATPNNFVGENLYGNLDKAFLQAFAAKKLAEAQRLLKKQHPKYRLLVCDAARPQHIQRKMWEKVRGTPKVKYVSSPKKVSMHSYGVAVDVSILDETGKELDMGTPVDFLGEKAEPRKETTLLQSGQLTKKQVDNRLLLRSIMRSAGFKTIPNEWWHFEACTRSEAEAKYKAIE